MFGRHNKTPLPSRLRSDAGRTPTAPPRPAQESATRNLAPPAGQGPETVHQCPAPDQGTTGCCGRTPFELPTTDRMTEDPTKVTCHGRPRSYAEEALRSGGA